MQAPRFIRGLRPHLVQQPAGERALVRFYERQSQLEHDLKRLHRRGWRLESVTHGERTFPLEIVRGSAPGTILNLPRHCIQARFRFHGKAAEDQETPGARHRQFGPIGAKFAAGARDVLHRRGDRTS